MKIVQYNSSNSSDKKSAGFTLVESIVALALGGIMLTSLYGCFASGFATVSAGRENLRATQVMITKLEQIRLATFDQLTSTNYFPRTFSEFFDPADSTNHAGGTIYSGTFSAAVPASGTLPESYRTNMLLVSVTLNWNSGGLQHSRTMQTYAAKNGIEGYVSVGQ